MADGHLARKSPSFGMIKPCYPVVLPSRQKPPSKWIHWTSRRISRLHERITAQLHAIVRSKSREWCLTSSRHGDRDRESERERCLFFLPVCRGPFLKHDNLMFHQSWVKTRSEIFKWEEFPVFCLPGGCAKIRKSPRDRISGKGSFLAQSMKFMR